MGVNLDEISRLLGDKAEQGWHKDPEDKTSVLRSLQYLELDGHHNLICQCNGSGYQLQEELADFIAAAPTIIKELVERVLVLEDIASTASEVASSIVAANECRRNGKISEHMDLMRDATTDELDALVKALVAAKVPGWEE